MFLYIKNKRIVDFSITKLQSSTKCCGSAARRCNRSYVFHLHFQLQTKRGVNVNVIQFPIKKTKPFSEANNPIEYHNLPEYKKQALKRWINKALKPFETKQYYPHHSSYGLKHKFESSVVGFYVTNGQFKGAMLECGFIPKDQEELNWVFKLGKNAGKIKEKGRAK